MTPKEKAIELYEKFFYTIPSISDEGQLEHLISKQCALIAVDEIIEALNCNQWQNQTMIDWYNKVKEEIEKL